MTFTKYDTNESSEEPRVLTVEEKKGLTDDFIAGKSVISVKHEKFIPSNLIKQSYAKKKAIEKYVVKLMKGEVVDTPASFDEETGEETPATYVAKPTTLTSLKAEAIKKFPSCGQEAFDYNIDKIIEVATEAGTWTAYKALF